MTAEQSANCTDLIIQPYPIDTLANIAHVRAFFKEFYEVDNPDFTMSDQSRLGFYILLAMVQQAAEFEVMRLEDEGMTQTTLAHKSMPESSREALRELFTQMLDNTDEGTAH